MSHSTEHPTTTDPLDDSYVRHSGAAASSEDAWDTLARVALVGLGGVFVLAVVAYAVVLFVAVNQ